MAQRWYIVHCYSGFEKKVAQSVMEQAENQDLGEMFENVLVPSEEVVEMRAGKKVSSERKFFPGYVLVHMEMTDQTWHLVRNTPKVTGFLGSGSKPMRFLRLVEEGDSADGQRLRSWYNRRWETESRQLSTSSSRQRHVPPPCASRRQRSPPLRSSLKRSYR